MIIAIPPTPVIAATHDAVSVAQAAATAYCKDRWVGNEFTNAGTGDRIVVTQKGVKHTLHGAQASLIRAMYVLPAILQYAERTGVVPDKHGRPDIADVRKYEVEMDDGGTPRIALVVAFHRRDGKIGFYDLGFLQR